MRKTFQLLLLLSAFLLPLQLLSSSVSANSAPVNFYIPDTSLIIKGFASPKAFVQIFDGSTLIGTVTADTNGMFEKEFNAMSSGLHNLKIQFNDQDGNLSDPLSQTINVRAQSDTAVEYFLPPTINVQPVSVVEGDLVTFSGTTIPNSIVEIVLDGGNVILRPQSGADGRYSISASTTGYYFGEHHATVKTSLGGMDSFESLKEIFIILPVESGANGGEQPARALDPPVIQTSSSSITTKDENYLLRGTAAPNTQIIIYLDGEPIGSTFTNAEGEWFFNLDISLKKHNVRSVACIDNACSDFSNLVTITFTGKFGKCSPFKFWLSEYRFWGVEAGSGIDLPIAGIGGKPSYQVLIDWGDADTELFNADTAQSMTIHHIYQQSGQFNGSIVMTDADGCEYSRFFSISVIEPSLDLIQVGLYSAPPIALVTYLLKRRYTIHKKKIRLAR